MLTAQQIVDRYPEFHLLRPSGVEESWLGNMVIDNHFHVRIRVWVDNLGLVNIQLKCRQYAIGVTIHPTQPLEHLDEMLYQELRNLLTRATQIPLLGKMGQ